MKFASLVLLFALPAWAAPPSLQALIDAVPAGGELRLPPGRYAGPAVVAKPMTLAGQDKAVIDGGGKGTVLTLRTSGATVRGLTLSGSGDSHDAMDAGIQVEGDDNLIEGNVVADTLFGVHIRQGDRNRVLKNRVSGKDLPLGLRGDGLRLWNSRHNRIADNSFERTRDITLANSPDNQIVGNRLDDGRYGMHIVFSPRTLAADNRIAHTGTGIVVLYSPDVTLRGNTIAHALESGGAGIVFKDSGTGLVEGNEIVHCTAGLQANTPLNPELVLTIRHNRFAHNIVGMSFYGEQGGHRITANRFENNLAQVVAGAPGTGSANIWRGNHWSDYQGFDRDGDGVGDTPYELYAYADRIWMEIPKTKFFANSPVLELLDFLERLAPFSAPSLILRDTMPQMR
ncbi:MAG: copper ABC transporter substrate-binding protein [Rhodocyclales bacterium GWA2_65_20]|nr:MAG: copper ABC transporter substrate-binding protein [Rhodocyclales bacterium GWA2_65_20]